MRKFKNERLKVVVNACKRAMVYLFVLNPIALWFWALTFPEEVAEMISIISREAPRWRFLWKSSLLSIKALPWRSRKYFWTRSCLVGASQRDKIRYANHPVFKYGVIQREVVKEWLLPQDQVAWFLQAPADMQTSVIKYGWLEDDVLAMIWEKSTDSKQRYDVLKGMKKQITQEHFSWLMEQPERLKNFWGQRTLPDVFLMDLIRKVDSDLKAKGTAENPLLSYLKEYVSRCGLSFYVIEQIFDPEDVSENLSDLILSYLRVYSQCQQVQNLRGTNEKNDLWKRLCQHLKNSEEKLSPEAEILMDFRQLDIFHQAGLQLSEVGLHHHLYAYRYASAQLATIKKICGSSLSKESLALIYAEPLLATAFLRP